MSWFGSVPKFGSKVTYDLVNPFSSSNDVQWLAVRNTRGEMSVPLQMMRRLPSALGINSAPTLGWPLPSATASPVCASAKPAPSTSAANATVTSAVTLFILVPFPFIVRRSDSGGRTPHPTVADAAPSCRRRRVVVESIQEAAEV